MAHKVKKNSIEDESGYEYIMSQAGVSPRLIKYHANYLISTDDANTRS